MQHKVNRKHNITQKLDMYKIYLKDSAFCNIRIRLIYLTMINFENKNDYFIRIINDKLEIGTSPHFINYV